MRKSLILILAIVCTININAKSNEGIISSGKLESFKEKLNAIGDESFTKLKELADYYLDVTPEPITKYPSPIETGSNHDYYSDSPYWWPDPENPSAPYIRKDGVRNPDRFMAHKNLFKVNYQAVTSLAFCAYLFDKKEYAEKAKEFLYTWLVNPETRMAPNLKFAQMIRNKNVVRGVGIIDTHRFPGMLEALKALKKTGFVEPEFFNEVDNWILEYYNWLKFSEWGVDEKERGNNHSSWYAAQLISIAAYLGKENDLQEFADYVKHFLIDNQFMEDCSQPKEELRTKSLSYSVFNLNALSVSASVLKNNGIDIWNYQNKNGCSLIKAAERINKYVIAPEKWYKQQIYKFKARAQLYMMCAAISLDSNEYYSLCAKLPAGFKEYLKGNEITIDPFDLLLYTMVKSLGSN